MTNRAPSRFRRAAFALRGATPLDWIAAVSEDMKGASIMKVEGMVKVAVKGMQTDRFEIRPGQANQLKMMSRLAPRFIFKQMSRSVDRMLRTHN